MTTNFKILLSLVIALEVLGNGQTRSPALAQEAKTREGKPQTGEERLEERLNAPVTVSFQDKPLRECLETLGTQMKVTVVLMRPTCRGSRSI